MAVYGPGCYPQNIIWTEATGCLGPIQTPCAIITDLGHIKRPLLKHPFINTIILTGSLTKTNRETINVKHNII